MVTGRAKVRKLEQTIKMVQVSFISLSLICAPLWKLKRIGQSKLNLTWHYSRGNFLILLWSFYDGFVLSWINETKHKVNKTNRIIIDWKDWSGYGLRDRSFFRKPFFQKFVVTPPPPTGGQHSSLFYVMCCLRIPIKLL